MPMKVSRVAALQAVVLRTLLGCAAAHLTATPCNSDSNPAILRSERCAVEFVPPHAMARGHLPSTTLQGDPMEPSNSRGLQDASSSGADDGSNNLIIIVGVVGLGLLVFLVAFLCLLARCQRSKARKRRQNIQDIQKRARPPHP